MSTETTTDTSTLAGLDFEPVLPCEHPDHGRSHDGNGRAEWVCRATCPLCLTNVMRLVCEARRQEVIRFAAEGTIVWHTAEGEGCDGGGPVTDWRYSFTPIGGAR